MCTRPHPPPNSHSHRFRIVDRHIPDILPVLVVPGRNFVSYDDFVVGADAAMLLAAVDDDRFPQLIYSRLDKMYSHSDAI